LISLRTSIIKKKISFYHPHGIPENILRFSEDDSVIYDEELIRTLFEHPDVKNRKIVALSIIGVYRKGKSFFLDYCLRFLYGNVS